MFPTAWSLETNAMGTATAASAIHPGRARAMVGPCARSGSPPETIRPAIARLGQGNLTAVTLKDHLFPKVVDAPRNDASESHARGAGWARGPGGFVTSGSPISCRMEHAVHQHPQAPIEFRLPERLSEHRHVAVRLAEILLRSRHKHEWDALGIEPFGYREHHFAVAEVDIKQRPVAPSRFDQRKHLGHPSRRA